MKIKLSKSQWQQIGKTAGWMKKAGMDEETYWELHNDAIRDMEAFEEQSPKTTNWESDPIGIKEEFVEKFRPQLLDLAKGIMLLPRESREEIEATIIDAIRSYIYSNTPGT